MSSHLFFCGIRTDPRVLCTLRRHSTAILSSHTGWSICIFKVWMTSFSFWCHLRTLPNLTPWIVNCFLFLCNALTSFRSGHLSPQSPLSWLLWRYKVLSKVPFCPYRPSPPLASFFPFMGSHSLSPLLLSLSLQLHIFLLIYFHSRGHHTSWPVSLRHKTSSSQAKGLGPEHAMAPGPRTSTSRLLQMGKPWFPCSTSLFKRQSGTLPQRIRNQS